MLIFDTLQVLFWGITYLLIIFFSIKNYSLKRRCIPLLAVLLNFAWEINAVIIHDGFWAHVLWMGLDIFIVIYSIYTIPTFKYKIIYFGSIVAISFIINIICRFNKGFLISVFTIDLIMALCFWIDRKRLLPNGRVIIGVTKLLGDLFAAIMYYNLSIFVLVSGILVLFINISYLIWCISNRPIHIKGSVQNN